MCAATLLGRRRLDGVMRVSRRLRVVAREGSPADAPAVRSALTAVPTRPRIISRTALRRAFWGRTPGAHVKVLVSHDASELVAVCVAARRRFVSARTSKFMAARVGWRPLVGPQRAL